MKHKVEIELPFFVEYPDYHDDAILDLQALIPGLQSRELGLTRDNRMYLFAYYLGGDEVTNEELWKIAESKNFHSMTDEQMSEIE